MRLPSLVLLALLRAPAAAQDGPSASPAAAVKGFKSVDLSGQFADPPTRDQSVIGNCHAFASVALLEAAYFRAQGHRVRLSEEDLFFHGTILTGDAYAEPCFQGLRCVLNEGNFIDKNLHHALRFGVLTGSRYSDFEKRFKTHRSSEARVRRALASVRAESFLNDFVDDAPPDPWIAYIQEPEVRREIAAELGDDLERTEPERLKIRDLLKDASLSRKDFELVEGKSLPPAECRAAGAGRFAAIKGELDAGRPVAVSMHLTGLKSWGNPKDQHFYHGFAITGYKQGKTGLLFTVRNSWAGVNPPVPEWQLCRIYTVETLLVAGEKPSF